MNMVKFILFTCFFTTLAFAQEQCIKEGRHIPLYPGAPSCCEGLGIEPPPERMVGSAGKCIKEVNCVELGDNVIVYQNAPSCCEGLILERHPRPMPGNAGKCVEDSSKCVSEGDHISLYPGSPSSCCRGLELKDPPKGLMGSGGQCVKKIGCVEEGKSVVVYPNAPQCCVGLKLQAPPEKLLGVAGRCIKDTTAESLNVNDESIMHKDPFRNIMNKVKSTSPGKTAIEE